MNSIAHQIFVEVEVITFSGFRICIHRAFMRINNAQLGRLLDKYDFKYFLSRVSRVIISSMSKSLPKRFDINQEKYALEGIFPGLKPDKYA